MSDKKPSRIEIGPDGSLARITSSVRENNIMIPQTPDSGVSKPRYKIITLGTGNTQHESSSDKSDEEMEDAEICSIDISIETMKLNALQQEKCRDNSTNERINENKIGRKERPKMNKSPNASQLKNFQHRERFSRFSDQNRSDVHNSSIRNRNYNVSDKSVSQYRNSGGITTDISPWMEPMLPPMYESPLNMSNHQMAIEKYYPEFPQLRTTESALEPMMQPFVSESSFVDSNHSTYPYREMPSSSTGLLGDYPSHPIPHQFQQNPPEIWLSQSYSSNFHRSVPSEIVEQNQRNPYQDNYHRSGPPERSIPVEQNHRKSYQSNMPYSTWQRKRGKWRKNEAKNRKKWRNRKAASSASNTNGYRQ